MFKLLHLLGKSHPFPVLRLTALKRWVDGGEYAKVLNGAYPKRGDDRAQGTVYEDVSDSVKHYRESVKDGGDGVSRFFTELGQGLSEAGGALWDQVRDAFKRPDDEGGEDDGDAGDDAGGASTL